MSSEFKLNFLVFTISLVCAIAVCFFTDDVPRHVLGVMHGVILGQYGMMTLEGMKKIEKDLRDE